MVVDVGSAFVLTDVLAVAHDDVVFDNGTAAALAASVLTICAEFDDTIDAPLFAACTAAVNELLFDCTTAAAAAEALAVEVDDPVFIGVLPVKYAITL